MKPGHPAPGRLFVMSAPSGAGKTTLRKALAGLFPDMLYSVSFTTRLPRPGEIGGRDYHFITQEEFEKRIQENGWAEWAEVFGNYYGTSARFIDEALASGRSVLLDIDVQGAAQVMEKYPESVTIFILPPSMEVLEDRLTKRSRQDKAGPDVVARRLAKARWEMDQAGRYKHTVVNDEVERAVAELASIFRAHAPAT